MRWEPVTGQVQYHNTTPWVSAMRDLYETAGPGDDDSHVITVRPGSAPCPLRGRILNVDMDRHADNHGVGAIEEAGL